MTGNKKLTELDALTTTNATDLVAVIDDVTGTPITKKVTLAKLLAGITVDGALECADFTSTGKVGIDIINPHAKLHIDGGIRFKPREQKALVTFIFDDGYTSDYTVMKPVFDAQGEVACIAMQTDEIGNVGRLSSAHLLALEDAGWEMMSHTVTHPYLTSLSESDLRDELSNSKTILEGLGLTINNIAYPYTDNNEMVRRITREYYRSARGAGSALNQQILETFELKAQGADDHTLIATYQALVDSAESQEKWMIFYLHSTNSDDVITMNTLIDYIQAKNISIVTVNQALDLIGNTIDIGDGFAVGEKGARIHIAEELTFEETASIKFGVYPEFHAFGTYNTFIGENSGNTTLSTATENQGFGRWTFRNITTGNYNQGLGGLALYSLTEGTNNTALGYQALYSVTTSTDNIGIGNYALQFNTATYNLGIGGLAGNQNTSGTQNIYIGYTSGKFNQTGSYNTAFGANSQTGVTGQSHSYNTSIGTKSLLGVTTGSSNTTLGYETGKLITTGEKNIIIGRNTGNALITGTNNILLGYDVEASATDATYEMNIGDILFADLALYHIGINTRVPVERLHIDEAGGTDGTGRWFANKSITTTDNSATGIYTLVTTTDKAYRLVANVIGIQDDGSNMMATSWSFVLKNVAGTLTELQSAVIGTEFDDSVGVSIDGIVSGTSYNIRVTGIAAETWNWEISIDATVVAH